MDIGDRFGQVVIQSFQGSKVTVCCDCGIIYEIGKAYLSKRKATRCFSCGWVKRRVCQIGNHYDHLTVIDLKSEAGRLWARCRCDCGKEITTRSDVLLRNKTNSCGCEPGVHWRGFGGISLTYYNRLKAGAKIREIPFEVSIQYLWDLLNKQEYKCALSGIPIVLNLRTAKASTASVDRIDNSVGYLPGNIQWVHRDINRMKLHHQQSYFLALCRCVVDFQRGLEISVPDKVFLENNNILKKRGKR